MNEQIANDIELLVKIAKSEVESGTPETDAAADRVEAWLATYKETV